MTTRNQETRPLTPQQKILTPAVAVIVLTLVALVFAPSVQLLVIGFCSAGVVAYIASSILEAQQRALTAKLRSDYCAQRISVLASNPTEEALEHFFEEAWPPPIAGSSHNSRKRTSVFASARILH